jgi:hypothetical protein
MDKKTLIIAIVAVLAIAGSVLHLVRSNSADTPRASMKPFEYLGSAAATEVAALLKNQGDVVLVMETMGNTKNPNAEAQVKGFKAGLGKAKGMTLKAVKELPRSMSEDPRLWPAQHATQLIGMGAGAKAVVYLGSFPETLPPNDIATLKGSHASLVVVGTQSPMIQSLVTSGVIRLAVVGKTPPPPAPSTPESTPQWYARVYAVLKAP